MANSVDPDQTAPIGSGCSGSTLFASILKSSVRLGNFCSRRLQQTTFSDAFFFFALEGLTWGEQDKGLGKNLASLQKDLF